MSTSSPNPAPPGGPSARAGERRLQTLPRDGTGEAPPTWRVVLPLSLVAGAAGALVVAGTRLGLTVGSDSVEFLVAARNLIAGRGLGLISPSGRLMPLRLHPPLYPLVLSAFRAAGLDSLDAGRWFNVGLMVGLVLLTGFAAFRLTRSLPIALGIAALMGTWAPLIDVLLSALSEPLFLFLGLVSIILLYRATGRGRSSLTLALAGLMVGLTTITRYQGVALLAAGATYLAMFGGGPWRARAERVAGFIVIATVPLLLWIGVLAIGFESSPGGIVIPGRALWSTLAPFRIALADLFWEWLPLSRLLPDPSYRAKLAWVGVGLLVFLGSVVLSLSQARGSTGNAERAPALRVGVLLAGVALAYAGLTAFAYAFRVPQPDLNDRTLFPIAMGMTGAALAVLLLGLDSWLPRRTRLIASSIVLVAFIGLQLPETLALVNGSSQQNGGLTGPGWRTSCTLEALDRLPPDIRLISNETAAILLYRDEYPYEIPELETRTRAPVDAPFGYGDHQAERLFQNHQAALVLFRTMIWDLDALYHKDAEARLEGMTSGLVVFADCEDGTIYFPPPNSTPASRN